jgi:hypothetical protein
MTRQSDNVIELCKEHLNALRRGCHDAAEHITSSREAIEHSFALLRLADKIEGEQRR